jgi:predicted CopG family antitoxin
MVKTTITIEDELYKKLAKEAVERYGTVRTLSKLINEKLKKDEIKTSPMTKELVKKAFGSLRIKPSGEEYVKNLRKEWR